MNKLRLSFETSSKKWDYHPSISITSREFLSRNHKLQKILKRPSKRKFSHISLVKHIKQPCRYMKKRITQILFSLLTFCTNADIYAQENEKKTKNPWSGSVSLNYDFTNNFTGNVNLGYTQKNWDLFLDYSGHSDRIEISSELFRSFSAETSQLLETEQHHLSHSVAIQLDMRPSSRNLFLWNLKLQFPKITTNRDINNRTQTKEYDLHHRIAFSRKTIEGSLFYKHIYETNKHELSLNGIFSHTKDARPSTYQIDDLLTYTTTGNEKPEFVRLQIDYLYTFENQGQLETGIQFFSRWNKTRYNLHDTEETLDNWLSNLPPNDGLNHREYIYTAHLSYSRQQGEFWLYKIGLHADYDITHTKLMENTDKHNFDRFYFYPHLTLQYTPSDQQELAFHFTRKAAHPDYTQLNPFTNPIDHQTFEQGNPLLRPEITNRAEINYLLHGEKIQLNGNLYFNSTKRFITPVTLFSEDNTLTLSYTNGNMENKVGLDINLSGSPTSWMTITPSISLVHAHANGKYQGINLHVDDFSWSGNLELNLNSKKHTEFQALFSYQSPTKVPQFKIEENYHLDLAIKQGFFDNRLQVSFSVSDVFDTSEWQARSNTDTYRLANYSKEATHAYWIGLTFNFNNFKSRSSADDSHPQKRQIIQLGQ